MRKLEKLFGIEIRAITVGFRGRPKLALSGSIQITERFISAVP